jgi:hypothetical protein
VLVATALVSALALTGLLAFQDRENADAASPARANTARDAIAYESLQQVSRSTALASSLQRVGILGLQSIGIRDFQSVVVSQLGGTIAATPDQWTLALGGGWACLSWPQGSSWRAPSVSRGVCSGAPIVRTPSVSAAALARAVQCTERQQRAALDAAFVAVAISSPAQGFDPRFSMTSLAGHFDRLGHVGFRATVTSSGVTVMSKTSEACLTPTPSAQLVRIVLGPCA